MEKFAVDDAVDDMNRIKRTQAKQAHSDKVSELLNEKRRLAEEDRAREAALNSQAKCRDDEFALIVQQERVRLLAEHAANLADNLPKGLVQSSAEMAVLNDARAKGPNKSTAFAAQHGKF
jgi:hypothetical protein